MAQLFCTGPVLVYIGIPRGNSRVPAFLGTAEKAPQIIVNSEFEPVFNDIGGSMIPIAELFQGETAVVSMVLTRFNEATVQAVRSLVGPRPGFYPTGSYGTIMEQEGFTFPLYLRFPYVAKPSMAGMVPGYRFWSAKFTGPLQVVPGTTALRKQIIFGCTRSWTLASSPLAGTALPVDAPLGNSILYDHNMAEVLNVPVN